MSKELISIIIPVYNIGKYVSVCIESIMCQTYSCLEIILIDDGSTDGSGKICEDYAKRDDRVIVVHKENGGLSDARNAGIKIANGEYIGFVDGDDYVSPIMFETMFSAIKKYDCEIVACRITKNSKNLKIHTEIIAKDAIIDCLPGFDAIHYLFNDLICGNFACNKLYKKSLFKNILYPKGKAYEDVYTTHFLFEKAKRVLILDVYLYYYRERERQITNDKEVPYALIIDHIGAYEALALDPKLEKYKTIIYKNFLVCLKRCKRLIIQNSIKDIDKKSGIVYVNNKIRMWCKKQNLNNIDYVQSKILLWFNKIPVLYDIAKVKRFLVKLIGK